MYKMYTIKYSTEQGETGTIEVCGINVDDAINTAEWRIDDPVMLDIVDIRDYEEDDDE